MKSTLLKSRIAHELGLKPGQVAVRTIPSVKADKWVDVRIRIKAGAPGLGDFEYPARYSELHRRIALAIVYGEEFARKQSAGGNIGAFSISLFESQWDRFVETLDAVATCAEPDADAARKLEIALVYLANRS
jgi:hypothetical protein